MNVLYVNHTAEISGGERSLLDLLASLPDVVRPLLATPPGPLQREVEALGIPTTRIVGTDGSLRLHPLRTTRALLEMAVAAWQVRRAAKRHSADLVHANSIRGGIVLAFARFARTPTIVHVRDCLPPGRASTATLRLIAASATIVVANSRYTADSVRAVAPDARLAVVYNPVDLARFDPQVIDRGRARARLGAADERRVLLGVLAQLSPWKGQDTAIEALALLCQQGVDAHLLLVGSAKFVTRSTRFDNEGYVARLKALVERAGLEERVSWLGERRDVPEILRALDVLLLPSWEEPFGRAIIEAMALAVPVIATNVGGPAEIIEDGRDGLLLAPREPDAWASAVHRVIADPDAAAEMARAGRRRVEDAFASEHHVRAILDLYDRAIATKR